MAKMIKATSTFLANRELWLEGETKEASDNQALELVKAGLAVEAVAANSTQPAQRETKPAKTAKLEKK